MPSRARQTRLEPEEELVRLMAILVRRQAATQAEAIHEMKRAGFGNARIAELLGTTADTVKAEAKRSSRRG